MQKLLASTKITKKYKSLLKSVFKSFDDFIEVIGESSFVRFDTAKIKRTSLPENCSKI